MPVTDLERALATVLGKFKECLGDDSHMRRFPALYALMDSTMEEFHRRNRLPDIAVSPSRESALRDVIAERLRQDKKWGEQNHNPTDWIAILGEEFGEAAKECVEARFARTDEKRRDSLLKFRSEMVQTAAVALAMIECLDRGTWDYPEGQRIPSVKEA